jgi:hypothetical protein
MPFNPENPYQRPSASDQHMLRTFDIPVGNQYMLPTPPASAEHTLDISAEQPLDGDTIVVDPNRASSPVSSSASAYADHMLPPSNQAQGALLNRKRTINQISQDNNDLNSLSNNVQALRDRVAQIKKRKQLLKEQEDLERELIALEG